MRATSVERVVSPSGGEKHMLDLHHVVDALRAAYGTWGYPLVLVGALLENTALLGLVLPGGSLVLLGAVYAQQGVLALPLVLVLGTLGARDVTGTKQCRRCEGPAEKVSSTPIHILHTPLLNLRSMRDAYAPRTSTLRLHDPGCASGHSRGQRAVLLENDSERTHLHQW